MEGSSHTPQLARNVKRLGHLDLPGSGQVYVQGNYAYLGHLPNQQNLGTTIVDVSDPRKPRVVSQINLDDPTSHSHKARVIGDIMIVNSERNMTRIGRKADELPGLRARLREELGRDPSHTELAAKLGVNEADIPAVEAAQKNPYERGGFKIYDVSDRAKPKLITFQKTHGIGVHRFDMDARYAYISTEMEGYVGNILVIYDLAKPDAPQEVSRWWLPGQHVAGGETPTWESYKNRLHHALRSGDELWAAVWNAGLRVIDVSDIRRPRTVAEYNYHPPFPEPTHTVLPVPFPVAGCRIAVAVDEEHDHIPGQPHAGLWVFDVSDLADIRPLSMFHVGEMDSPWSRTGRFGAHQFQEHLSDTLVYVTWFSGGLRIVDVADPSLPREVGHFIPEPSGGNASPQSNDVDVDARGLIYLLDRNQGLDILEYTGAR